MVVYLESDLKKILDGLMDRGGDLVCQVVAYAGPEAIEHAVKNGLEKLPGHPRETQLHEFTGDPLFGGVLPVLEAVLQIAPFHHHDHGQALLDAGLDALLVAEPAIRQQVRCAEPRPVSSPDEKLTVSDLFFHYLFLLLLLSGP